VIHMAGIVQTLSRDWECSQWNRCTELRGSCMLCSGTMHNEQRIWDLLEIANEALCPKLRGEDKIRIAAQVADFLKTQNENMASLLHIPFNCSILSRHMIYPHIAPPPTLGAPAAVLAWPSPVAHAWPLPGLWHDSP
jgi:hypothetical protein